MTVAATDEAEGAQALFCYIADRLGAFQTHRQFGPYIKSKDSKGFFKQYKDMIDEGYNTKRIDTTKSKSVIISYINKQPTWFVSSLMIAEKIITEIDKIDKDFSKIKAPGWQNLFYQHGDEEIMNTLSALYKSANLQSAKEVGATGTFFGDINKWTPADIYFASSRAKTVLKNLLNEGQTKANNLRFATLNKTVKDLMLSGDLLPLSLKKVTKNYVLIEKVNFSRASENKVLAETYCTGIQPWQKMTGSYKIVTNKSFQWTKEYKGGRDIYVKIKSGKKTGRLHFRATPASGGRPSGGIKMILGYDGASALGGQVASIPLFVNLIDSVDKQFSGEFQRTWNKGIKKFKTDAMYYIEYGGGRELYQGNSSEKKQFNDDMGAISALTVMNDIRPLIDNYFRSPGEKQHNLCRAIFAYTGSRTAKSARFIIAKD